MKIGRDYFSLRVLLAAGVLAALLSTCGYVPWPSEVKAKRVAVEKLRSTLEALPKPADFRSAKFPGTDSDDVRYHGIYRAKNAEFSSSSARSRHKRKSIVFPCLSTAR